MDSNLCNYEIKFNEEANKGDTLLVQVTDLESVQVHYATGIDQKNATGGMLTGAS